MAERTIETPTSALTRTHAFIAEYQAAPNDADIEVRRGRTETGEPAVVISINGSHHAFTVTEARIVADIAESALNKYPAHPDSAGLPNLILALRHGAEAASLPESPEAQEKKTP
jgi:hypothetical protein